METTNTNAPTICKLVPLRSLKRASHKEMAYSHFVVTDPENGTVVDKFRASYKNRQYTADLIRTRMFNRDRQEHIPYDQSRLKIYRGRTLNVEIQQYEPNDMGVYAETTVVI